MISSLHQFSWGPSISSRSPAKQWDNSAWTSSPIVKPLPVQQLQVTQSMRPDKRIQQEFCHARGMDLLTHKGRGGPGFLQATIEAPITSPASLSAAISSCSSLTQLSSLHGYQSSRMDLFHCVAMMIQLPKASDLHYMARQQLPDNYLPLTDDLVLRMEPNLDMLAPRQLSNLLWAVARLQLGWRYLHFTQGLLSRLLSLDQVPPASEPGHNRMDVHSPLRLSHFHSQSLVRKGNGQDLSITAWAFARLILDGSCPSFSGRSADASEISLPLASWSDIHMAAFIFQLSAARLSTVMRSQEISNTIWAIAKLSALAEKASGQHYACGEDEDDIPHPSQCTGLDQPPPTSLIPLLRSFLSDGVLRSRVALMAQTGLLNHQHIPTIIWACARLRVHDDKGLLEALADSMLKHVRKSKPRGLSMSLWALARLGYQHPALLQAVAGATMIRLNRKDPKFSGQCLANLAWALTEFRYYDPTLFSLIAREALYKLDELRPVGLTTLLSSWAASGFYNISLFTMAGRAALLQLDKFYPSTLVRLMESCTHVGHSDPVLLAASSRCLAAHASAGVMTLDQKAVAVSSVCGGLSKLLKRERIEVFAFPSCQGPNKLEHLLTAEDQTLSAITELSSSLSPYLMHLSPRQLASVASAVANCSLSLSFCGSKSLNSNDRSVFSGGGRFVSPGFASGIREAAIRRSEELKSLPLYGALLWSASELGCMDEALMALAAESVVAKLSLGQKSPKWLALVLLALTRAPASPDSSRAEGSNRALPDSPPAALAACSVDDARSLLAQNLVLHAQELDNDTMVALLKCLVWPGQGFVYANNSLALHSSSSAYVFQLARILLQETLYRLEQGALRLHLIINMALQMESNNEMVYCGNGALCQTLRHRIENCIREALQLLPTSQHRGISSSPLTAILTPGLSIRAAQALVHLGNGHDMDVPGIRRALGSAAYGIRAAHGAPGEAILPTGARSMVVAATEIMERAGMLTSDAKLLRAFNQWLD